MRLTRTSRPALISRPPSDRGLKGFPCGLVLLHFESLFSLGLVAARPRRVKQRVAYLSRYYYRGSGESCAVAQNVITLSKYGLLWEPTYFFQRKLVNSFPESSITTTKDILPN